MSIYSIADMQAIARSSIRKSQYLAEARESRADIFLSYSSLDREMAEAALVVLRDQCNVRVYMDAFDQSLPEPPDVTTAIVLRNQLRSIPKLVVVASTNTHVSRWIPWELGISDGNGGGFGMNCAVWPVSQYGEKPAWVDSLYFHVYPRVEKDVVGVSVRIPGRPYPLPIKRWVVET